jgi:hypothetical protein
MTVDQIRAIARIRSQRQDFGGITRSGPPKAFGVDPWLISCAHSGRSGGGFAGSSEGADRLADASTFQRVLRIFLVRFSFRRVL